MVEYASLTATLCKNRTVATAFQAQLSSAPPNRCYPVCALRGESLLSWRSRVIGIAVILVVEPSVDLGAGGRNDGSHRPAPASRDHPHGG